MKSCIVVVLLLVSSLSWSQKAEKIKGSKVVTIEKVALENFSTLEIGDNFEVFLERGEQAELKIEADDNLHSMIAVDLKNEVLQIKSSKIAVSFKKLILRVTYTSDLKLVISKNEAVINAIQEIQLEDITFKSYNESKLNLNVNVTDFILQSDDKSKVELNLKANTSTIQLSKNSSLKALIATYDLNCDLYQKTKANLEGDVNYGKIRLDNNADFMGQNLVIKNCDLITEGYSNANINTTSLLNVDASGNSEIKIYGNQKIELKQFVDSASLIKKPTK